MDYEKIEQDATELVKKYGVDAASDFLASVDNEGLVYYITNFGNPYEKDPIYKEYLNKPFLEALEFLKTLTAECENFLDEFHEHQLFLLEKSNKNNK